MDTAPDKPTMTNETKPSQEHEQFNDDYEESFASSSCFSRLCCFPCYRNSNTTEYRTLLQEEFKDSWWMKKAKSLKESSELLAGPKWKTFIRKFNNNNSSTATNKKKKQKSQFQYDPLSYALNFDGGADHEEDYDFSARFASSGKNTSELVHDPSGYQLNH